MDVYRRLDTASISSPRRMGGARRVRVLAACLAAVLTQAACFALPAEEPAPPPPVLSGAAAANYRTVMVTRSDVTLYRDINAQFVPAREELLSFAVNDELIENVYVEAGDAVSAGDVIAELNRDFFIAELKKSERARAVAEMNLRHLDERQRLAVKRAELTDTPLDDLVYRAERDALQTELDSIDVRIAYLRGEDERRVLRAGMDGVVTSVLNFREGDTSRADQRVATVADQDLSVFMARGEEVSRLQPGERHELTVNRIPYEAEVVDPVELGIERYQQDETYMIVSDPAAEPFSSRTYGTLHLVLEEALDALSVPVSAVKRANARVFVYVLENGVRTVRDVTVGLTGNLYVEIRDGLAEGDSVIMD